VTDDQRMFILLVVAIVFGWFGGFTFGYVLGGM
jgi:hypothetical protein